MQRTEGRVVPPGAPSCDLGGENARAVYRDLLRFGPRSRSELTARLELSAPTVTRVTRELLGKGLLHPLDVVARPKGRPQEPLDIAENEGPRFIGVKVTADEVHAVVTSVRGNVLEELVLPWEDTVPSHLVEVVAKPIAALATAHPHVIGVGLSLGGRVAGRRTVVSCEQLGWDRPVELSALLEERVRMPVAVENDLLAFLQGLNWFGRGRSYRSFALLTVGAGTGVGIVHDDRVLEGHTHSAGLTQRLPVGLTVDDEVIAFGQAARTADLLGRARARGILEAGEGTPRLRALLAAGDRSAHDLVSEMARALARTAASVIALLDPEAILLGGETIDLVRAVDPVFDDTLREAVSPWQRDITVRDLGPEFDEWARGAAIIAIQDFVGRQS